MEILNINIYTLMYILIIHWIGDFILQTNWQAQNKSKSNKALLSHILTYSYVWFIGSLLLFSFYIDYQVLILYTTIFVLVTFISHFVTDYYTSRLVKYYNNKKDIHNMFVVIGLDQILHYFQLFLTFLIIINYG